MTKKTIFKKHQYNNLLIEETIDQNNKLVSRFFVIDGISYMAKSKRSPLDRTDAVLRQMIRDGMIEEKDKEYIDGWLRVEGGWSEG